MLGNHLLGAQPEHGDRDDNHAVHEPRDTAEKTSFQLYSHTPFESQDGLARKAKIPNADLNGSPPWMNSGLFRRVDG